MTPEIEALAKLILGELNEIQDEEEEFVDVSGLAQECGFDFPMAFTRTAWALIEAPEEVVAAWPNQTTEFRLRAFLLIAHTVAATAPRNVLEVDVQLPLASEPTGNPDDLVHMKTFTMMVSPGPVEPVVTVIVQGEFDD